MRVLMLNHNIIGRGTYFRCYHLARYLVRLGAEVTIITTAGHFKAKPEVKYEEGVKIIITPRWGKEGKHDGGYAPIDILYRLWQITGARYDIYHSFDHRPNVSFPWLWKRLIKPAGAFFCDWSDWWTKGGIVTKRRPFKFLDHWESWLEEGTKKLADMVTVASKVLYQRAQGLNISPARLFYLPSGADTETIQSLPLTIARNKLGLPSEVKIVDFVGFSQWDLGIVLDAFKLVQEKVPNTYLMILGKCKEPKLLQRISQQDSIIYQSEVDFGELSLYLSAADVHLLPLEDNLANQARLPIKLGDYMASGRPIVTHKVGDTGIWVEKEKVGLATSQRLDDYAAAIIHLLKNDELREELGRQARLVAETTYNWRNRAEMLKSAYERTIEVKKTSPEN